MTEIEYQVLLEIDNSFDDYKRLSQYANIRTFKLVEHYMTGGKQ